MNKPFSLSKNERLKSKKQIDTLFRTGEAFFIFPFNVKYLFVKEDEQNAELKFGITIPKRYFKKAVSRNKLKRLSKEAYRIQKVALKEKVASGGSVSLYIMLIYTHNEMLSFQEITPVIKKCLDKLSTLMN